MCEEHSTVLDAMGKWGQAVISCTPSVLMRDLCCFPSVTVHWITADCPFVGGREEITTEPPQGHPGIAGGGTTANASAGKKNAWSGSPCPQSCLDLGFAAAHKKTSTTPTFLLKEANVH